MSLGNVLEQWKPPGCARFQRAGFGRGPMKEACTLEACAPRRFPEEELCNHSGRICATARECY
jgi:hypothetical protein